MTTCDLCDLPTPDPPVTGEDIEGQFCCRGCLEVRRHLGELTSDEDEDEDKLDTAIRDEQTESDSDTERPADAETAYLSVDGLHCTACERFVESMVTDDPGVVEAAVNYATDTAKIVYDPTMVDKAALPGMIDRLGYSARFPTENTTDTDSRDDHRILVGSILGMFVMVGYGLILYPSHLVLTPTEELGILVATLALGMLYCAVSLTLVYGFSVTALVLPLLQAVVFVTILGMKYLSTGIVIPFVAVLSLIIVFYTGYPFLRGAYVSVQSSVPNMDLLVGLAVIAALSYSLVAAFAGSIEVYFDVAVMIVLVVTLGNRIEDRVKHNAVSGLSAFVDARVEEATRRRADGTTETVAVETLSPGDVVIVRPGDRIPVDGQVREGSAAVDESLLTGESLPNTKQPGDQVTGGTIVTDNALVIEATEGSESTLDRLIDLVWEIQTNRTGIQALADRIAAVFVPFVIVLAALTTMYYLGTGAPLSHAILTGVAVLVVSCPCALGLATPLAVATGVRDSLATGVVVTDISLFERVSEIDMVVLDKTGTLTAGEMGVTNVVTADMDANEVLAMAAAVEELSNHPVAEAITNAVETVPETVTDVEHRTRGVTGTVGGRHVVVGHPDLFQADDWDVPETLGEAMQRDDSSLPVVVGWDGRVRGVVEVTDQPRAGWRQAVTALAGPAREVIVLTGDRESRARKFHEHPDVERVFSDIPPEGKTGTIQRLRKQGTVAMVGDGSNDAPALGAADLGIAMASGTELAADAADAVVTSDDLKAVAELFDIARGTRRRIWTNLGWALTYNAITIPLAVTGTLNPLFAAFAMSVSSLVVVGNSARSLSHDSAEDYQPTELHHVEPQEATPQ